MTTDAKLHTVRISELRPEWHVIDASGKTLGRLCTEVATLLQGKHKPTYTPYLMSGDFVVVVNASKVRVSGKKGDQKVYYRHTQYPGGLRQRELPEMLERFPARVISHSVMGMLPHNRLGRHLLKRLKIYAGETHPHQAQVTGSLKAKSASSQPEKSPESVEKPRPKERGKKKEA